LIDIQPERREFFHIAIKGSNFDLPCDSRQVRILKDDVRETYVMDANVTSWSAELIMVDVMPAPAPGRYLIKIRLIKSGQYYDSNFKNLSFNRP